MAADPRNDLDGEMWELSDDDFWELGCQCGSTPMPPCSFCTSHEGDCEWPDADCHCREDVTVPAIITPVPFERRPDVLALNAAVAADPTMPAPFWERDDLLDLDRHLTAMYDLEG